MNSITQEISGILSNAILRNVSKSLDSGAFSSVTGEQKRCEYLNMKEDKPIIHQVMSLPDKSIGELKALWRALFDQEPPKFGKNYLIPRLAYRLQELAYGPMPTSYTKKLDDMADALEKGKKVSRATSSNRLKSGTKLVREFQGKTYEVRVEEEVYIFDGQPFKSLSAIARHITGTRWNGPKFFGLRRG